MVAANPTDVHQDVKAAAEVATLMTGAIAMDVRRDVEAAAAAAARVDKLSSFAIEASRRQRELMRSD